MKHLYMCDGKKICDADFAKALKALGVKKGDTLFIHSDTMVFGKLAVQDRKKILSTLVKVFREAVGSSGTVAMPAFSYSWGKNEPFDAKNSKSTVGSLTEFFRNMRGVKRSIHPMLSVVAIGRKAGTLMNINKDSFGAGTVFENLHRMNAKIVLFGTTLTSCTFLHYIEQVHEVPYRFSKTFEGKIVSGKRTYRDTCTYFARPLDGSVENDMMKIGPYLKRKGVIETTMLGKGPISVLNAEDLFKAGMQALDKDPYALLVKKPV